MAKSRKALLQTIDKQLEIFKAAGNYENGYTELNRAIIDMANEYGFISDHGSSFSQKYCGGAPVPNESLELKEVLDRVKDYKDIGSLYVSFWRETTHFMEADPFEYCALFVAMLLALKNVVEQGRKEQTQGQPQEQQ